MQRRYLSVLGTLMVAVLILAACGNTDDDEPEPTVTRIPDAANAPVVAGESEDGEATADASESEAGDASDAQEVAGGESGTFEVVSFDIYFEPAEFELPANTDVTVVLPNEGAAPHNFSIDELDISVDLAPGETKEVVINAPAGEYEFYCDVPGHREAGMVGTLTVTEGAPIPSADGSPAAESSPEAEAAASPEAAEEASPVTEAAASPVPEEGASTPEAAASPAAMEDANPEAEGLASPAPVEVDSTPETGASPVAADDATPVAEGAASPAPVDAESTPAAEASPVADVESSPVADDLTSPVPAKEVATPESATPVAGTPEAASPTAGASIEIVSQDIFFEPEEFEIPADTDITITLPNEGAAPHNFSIDELDISVDLAPGETNEVVINAPAGEYEFYCNVPGHRQAGMVGILTVT